MIFRYLLFILSISFVGCVSTNNTSNDAFSFTRAYINEYEVAYEDTQNIQLNILERVLETKFHKKFKGSDAYKNHIKEIDARALVIVDETGERFDTLQLVNPTLSPIYSDSIIVKKCFFTDVTFDDEPDLVLELLFISDHRYSCSFDFEDGFVRRTKGKILICDLKNKKWIFEHLSELSFEKIPETEDLEKQPWSGFPYWKIGCTDSRRFLIFEFENKYLNAYEYEFPTYNRPFMLTKDEIKRGNFLNKRVFIYNAKKGYLDLEKFTKM